MMMKMMRERDLKARMREMRVQRKERRMKGRKMPILRICLKIIYKDLMMKRNAKWMK